MSGRWAGSGRHARLPADWARRRVFVLARDGYQCQLRGTRCTELATDVDHVIPGGSDDPSNLVAACGPCHRQKSSREGNAAKPSRRRPPRKHPGLK